MHYTAVLLSPQLFVFGMFAFIRCCEHLLYKYCELIKSEMIFQHFTFNSTKERIPDAINKYCIGIKQSLLFQWFSIILPGRVHFSWNLFIFSETRRCVTFQIEKLDTLLFIRNWEENIVPSLQTILAHLGVGHGRQRALDARHGGGHRQQSRHPESHPGGNLAHGSVGKEIYILLILPLYSPARRRTRRRPRSWSTGRRWWRCRRRAHGRTRGPPWGRSTPRWPWPRRNTCWCCWPSWSPRAERGWQQTAARPRLSKYRSGRS